MSSVTNGPPIAPEYTYLPPRFSAFSRTPKAGPATLSITTSSSRSITRSTPMARTCSIFTFAAIAITMAPRRFTNCTTAEKKGSRLCLTHLIRKMALESGFSKVNISPIILHPKMFRKKLYQCLDPLLSSKVMTILEHLALCSSPVAMRSKTLTW